MKRALMVAALIAVPGALVGWLVYRWYLARLEREWREQEERMMRGTIGALALALLATVGSAADLTGFELRSMVGTVCRDGGCSPALGAEASVVVAGPLGLTLYSRGQVWETTDGGQLDLDVTDARTFERAEWYVSATRYVAGRAFVGVAFGAAAPIDDYGAALLEPHPQRRLLLAGYGDTRSHVALVYGEIGDVGHAVRFGASILYAASKDVSILVEGAPGWRVSAAMTVRVIR